MLDHNRNTGLPDNEDVSLYQYFIVIWRHKWIVLLTIILIATLSVALPMLLLDEKYKASTELLQRRYDLDQAMLGSDVYSANSGDPERDILTSADLVTSPEVIDSVEKVLVSRLDGKDVEDMVEASAVQNKEILVITATDTDPILAADIANTFAREYIAWRQIIDKEALTQARIPIEQQLASVPESQRGNVGYSELVTRLETIKLAETLQVGYLQIVNEAEPPATADSPKASRNAVFGLLAGVLIGIGVAFFIEKNDKMIRSYDDLTASLKKPVLASVPAEPKLNGKVVTLDHPTSRSAEAYRLLRTNLSYISPDKKAKRLIITSSGSYEGKTTTVVNLAVAMAWAGKIVTIMELDFRRPRAYKHLNLKGKLGITDIIAGSVKLEDAIQVIDAKSLTLTSSDYDSEQDDSQAAEIREQTCQGNVKNIYFVGSGPIPPNPGELCASDALGDIIKQVSGYSDYVLMDTPPIGIVGDAAGLAQNVDGMLLVVRLNKSNKKLLEEASVIIDGLPLDVLGIVLTDTETRKSAYYTYK